MTLRFLLLLIARRLRTQIGVYKNVLKDSRTPNLAKLLLGIAVFYMMLPLDFIPDFIPLLGSLDDAFILPLLVGLAFFLVPQSVWRDARGSVKDQKVKQLDAG